MQLGKSVALHCRVPLVNHLVQELAPVLLGNDCHFVSVAGDNQSLQLGAAVVAIANVDCHPGLRAKTLDTLDVVGTVAHKGLVQCDKFEVKVPVLVHTADAVDTHRGCATVLIGAIHPDQVVVVGHDDGIFLGVRCQVGQDVVALNPVLCHCGGAQVAQHLPQFLLQGVEHQVGFWWAAIPCGLVGRLDHAAAALAVLAFKYQHQVTWYAVALFQHGDKAVDSILVAPGKAWH